MAHYQHPCKCLSCSLHFIACSEHEVWPQPNHPGDAIAVCPECASDALMRWEPRKVDEFIFQVVPGSQQLISIGAAS
jgi:hypothetical protein